MLTSATHDEAFFWSTRQKAEINLVLRRGDRLLGIECTRADSPRMTPSIRFAREDVGRERVAVLYPGTKPFPLADRVEAVPLSALAENRLLFPEGRG